MSVGAARTVRPAGAADGAACAAIYAPYVADTAITFELHAPTAAEMGERIARAQKHHAWLVLQDQGRVAGYAYGTRQNARPAYRWSCEVSIYLEPGTHRTGAGSLIYGALLETLAARGYKVAIAGMTLPNAASEALHRKLGFEPVGVYRRIGFKHGAWHDVAWVQRALGDQQGEPAEPR